MPVITLLVDLDGTITDPAPGMIGAFRFALERMGVTPPPADNLFWIIGPPTRLSFPKLLRADQDVEEAVRLYRERYGAGGLFDARKLFEAEVHPHIDGTYHGHRSQELRST